MQGLSQPSQWSHGSETELAETIEPDVELCEYFCGTLALKPMAIKTARVNLRSFQITVISHANGF